MKVHVVNGTIDASFQPGPGDPFLARDCSSPSPLDAFVVCASRFTGAPHSWSTAFHFCAVLRCGHVAWAVVFVESDGDRISTCAFKEQMRKRLPKLDKHHMNSFIDFLFSFSLTLNSKLKSRRIGFIVN